MKCHCESGRVFFDCCGRYLSGMAAPDATSLMKSRYTAYVLGNGRYLLDTWHPETRPERIEFEEGIKWLGLSVKRSESIDPEHATVEFVARFRIHGKGQRLHEKSRFVRIDGRWLYLDGEIFD